jgi:hypothetical protein
MSGTAGGGVVAGLVRAAAALALSDVVRRIVVGCHPSPPPSWVQHTVAQRLVLGVVDDGAGLLPLDALALLVHVIASPFSPVADDALQSVMRLWPDVAFMRNASLSRHACMFCVLHLSVLDRY